MFEGDEQTLLAIKAKGGDRESFEKLIECNLKFVVSIAREYLWSKMPLEDLIGEGNIGIIKAVGKYDETKGIKFLSYAVWWIRQSIMQSIYDNGSIVRLPVNRIAINTKINKAKESLYKELNREATEREISKRSGVSLDDVFDSVSDCNYAVEIDTLLDDDSNITFSDMLESDEFDDSEKESSRISTCFELGSVLSNLTDREQAIIKMYFGLESGEGMNLREIGGELDLTNERVRQIKDFALKKLRTFGNSIKLKEIINS